MVGLAARMLADGRMSGKEVNIHCTVLCVPLYVCRYPDMFAMR